MSDAIEKTAAGATRSFFGALGFILLMLGSEGMIGAIPIAFGVGLFLALLGGICLFAAFFWESAKKVLSTDAQLAIGRFAQSRVTLFGMIFLTLQTLILSPFVEQHRLPFTPASDYVQSTVVSPPISDQSLSFLKMDSDKKLRFATFLKFTQTSCSYVPLEANIKSVKQGAWPEFQQLLILAGWLPFDFSSSYAPEVDPGFTIWSSTEKGNDFTCAVLLTKAIQNWTSLRVLHKTGEHTPALDACKGQCVELDIGSYAER